MEILSGRLWIGDVSMYEAVAKPEADQWFVVHACKEPYHRKELGYTGRAAPKEHPEYLICRRPGRLILNLIDPPNPAYIPIEIIDAAIIAIHTAIKEGKKVLVHCNEGKSRAPSIAFLYLTAYGYLPTNAATLEDALAWFKTGCPEYTPGEGFRQFVEQNYDRYRRWNKTDAG